MPDTTSGFRAYNREAAIQMAVVSKFTYTLETIIQAGKLLVATTTSRSGRTPRRASRGCSPRCGPTSGATRPRSCASTRSTSRCGSSSTPPRSSLAALSPWGRFLSSTSPATAPGHVQSLILGAVLFNAAVVLAALGVIGDLLYGQRIMVQRIFERVRRIELQLDVPPSHYEPGASGRAAAGDHDGAHAGQTTEEREARQGVSQHGHGRPRGHGHRQHLRQVRLDQPGRPPPHGRLRAHAGRAVRPRRPAVAARRRAAARAC